MNNTCKDCKFHRVYYHGFQYNHTTKKREAVFSELCVITMKNPIITVGNTPLYEDCKCKNSNEDSHNSTDD